MNSNSVYQWFERYGYSTAVIDNYFFDHFDVKTDYKYSAESKIIGSINEFEAMLIEVSLLRIINDMRGLYHDFQSIEIY